MDQINDNIKILTKSVSMLETINRNLTKLLPKDPPPLEDVQPVKWSRVQQHNDSPAHLYRATSDEDMQDSSSQESHPNMTITDSQEDQHSL